MAKKQRDDSYRVIDSTITFNATHFCDWLEVHAPKNEWSTHLTEFWTEFFLQHSNSYSQVLAIGGFIPPHLRQSLWDTWGKGHPARNHILRLRRESREDWRPYGASKSWVSCGRLEAEVLREQLRRHPENRDDILRWLSPGQIDVLGKYFASNVVEFKSRKRWKKRA